MELSRTTFYEFKVLINRRNARADSTNLLIAMDLELEAVIWSENAGPYSSVPGASVTNAVPGKFRLEWLAVGRTKSRRPY